MGMQYPTNGRKEFHLLEIAMAAQKNIVFCDFGKTGRSQSIGNQIGWYMYQQNSKTYPQWPLQECFRYYPGMVKWKEAWTFSIDRSMVEDEGMPQSAKLRFETLIATSRGSALSDSKLQEVEGAFQDALEESQGLSIVTKHLYQELLGFLARSGQSEQIQARLKEMKLGGFPADQVTYGIIINALASSGFASLASSFFRQAEQEGIALTLPLCNAMLKASGSAGDLQAAEVGAVAGWNGGRHLFFVEVIPFPQKRRFFG